MKYLSIPVQFIKFWYPESLVTFIRVWKNTILYLEEDLAVGLMFKLLFVPLFHDSTIMGRFMSFFFRLFRICLGLFAFLAATVFIFLLAIFWFSLPLLAIIFTASLGWVLKIILFLGILFSLIYLISHPHKKVWQIKSSAEVWLCSLIKKEDLNFEKLLKTSEIRTFLDYLEIVPEQFLNFKPNFNEAATLEKVWEIGKKLAIPYLGKEHFFVALLSQVPNLENELMKLDLTYQDFEETLDFYKRKSNWWKVIFLWDENFRVKHLRGVNRGWMGVPTPALDDICQDLTKKAARQYIPDFVGRGDKVSQVINILSLEKGRNVALVGEPGAGKSELVEYLAKIIVSGDAPASLATKRIMGLDITRLLAGINTQGELAERIKNAFEEGKYCGDIVIFIDEIHELGIGEAGSEYNLYSLLLPYIEGSDFQFLATTETVNYSRILEKNGNFARLFTKVELPPATVSETVDILKNLSLEHERKKKIKTSLKALKAMAQLTSEYIHDRVLPDSAVGVFEQCLASAQDGWIKKKIVEKVIQDRTAIPVGEVEVETRKQLLNLEQLIYKDMVDQEEAVKAVANTLRRAGANLSDKARPIGSFLFVGPTGVGKTELAKILAKVFFEGKGHFLRFDMSEYQGSEAAERLIGKADREGILTEEVRNHPYSLILLDEFEKADGKLLTLFLQVLDDGRLTSGSGKLVYFTNTIIIATSNAASLTIAQGLRSGESLKSLEPKVKEELLTTFKPELINRFDGVVIFKTLSPEDLQKIVQLKLKILQEKLKGNGYEVEFDQSLVEKLAQKGFDPVLGARPLRRLIQDTLEARLSTMILENKLPKGEKFLAGEQLLNNF
ncbi:MAG: AAA family ATPase [Candidatus Daviesbacteria bacterium]